MNRAVVGLLASAALLTGCTRNAADAKPTVSAGVPPAVTVATVDFPSTWLAERVGGDAVTVRRVAATDLATTEADLVAYVPGLDPAVDTAVATLAPDRVVNVIEDVSLIERPQQPGSKDPYVWFDPINITNMSGTLGKAMAAASATPFEAYEYYGLRTLRVSNEALEVDQRLQEQLNPCQVATVVVQRPVLTYFARAYGLKQVPMTEWRPGRQPVDAVYVTPGERPITDQTTVVGIETLANGAPEDDLLQGVLDTAEAVAAHQDCPLVTPGSSDRPR